ncbi:hypothetical protein GC174_03500 [bacterium]|nr:hypothetical protein [bacterium]
MEIIEAATLTVKGAVDREMHLNKTQLEALELIELAPIDILSFSSRPLETGVIFAGTRLRKVLEYAGIKSYDTKIRSSIYIEVTARDSFKTIFSFHEVFNSERSDSIVVVTRKYGQAIGEDEGPFQIISAADTRTGSRWVRRLDGLNVRLANQEKQT